MCAKFALLFLISAKSNRPRRVDHMLFPCHLAQMACAPHYFGHFCRVGHSISMITPMTLESLLVTRDQQVIGVLRPALEKLSIDVEVCRGSFVPKDAQTVGFHGNVWLGYPSCATRKNLTLDCCRNQD